ncbi:MAG: HesA/MoeB/ThiF family protein [Acidovorax sp.]|uniref:HesA/MoeB/ThiF family protein n=1 Tax=Acidovorax sp. TaxID=1872122 RepID=UPI00391C6BAA
MTDDQLLRYSRHILLDEMGIEGQEKVLASHALIIGAGGLGSPAALYLASAGVGHITLVDDDVVDLTNLQRQIAHTTARVGVPKVDSAAEAMAAINPEVQVTALKTRVDAAQLDALVQFATVVLDCSDNYATRHAVNAACVKHGRPLVAGAVIRFDAQITVVDPRNAQSPCYACIFPPDAEFEEVRCSTMGVFAPLVGVVGAMQAAEALKLMAGIGSSLAGRLLMLDGRSMEWSTMQVQRAPECAVCAQCC